MSTTTTNYGLHKIDLSDAPPDITVLNDNWDTIDSELTNLKHEQTSCTGTGGAYEVSVSGIESLTAGVSFMFTPSVGSTKASPTINVNGLGSKNIRRRISGSTSTTVATGGAGGATNWLSANKPVRLTYDGNYWIADVVKPNANDLYGTVPIESGGTGGSTAKAALRNLGIMASTNEELVINAMECVGHVTSDRKLINFTIILPKMIDTSANSISVTSLKLNIRKAGGGYIGAASSFMDGGYQYVGNSNYTIGMDGLNPFCVRLYLQNNSSTFDTTNNTPVTVTCHSAILKVV